MSFRSCSCDSLLFQLLILAIFFWRLLLLIILSSFMIILLFLFRRLTILILILTLIIAFIIPSHNFICFLYQTLNLSLLFQQGCITNFFLVLFLKFELINCLTEFPIRWFCWTSIWTNLKVITISIFCSVFKLFLFLL